MRDSISAACGFGFLIAGSIHGAGGKIVVAVSVFRRVSISTAGAWLGIKSCICPYTVSTFFIPKCG